MKNMVFWNIYKSCKSVRISIVYCPHKLKFQSKQRIDERMSRMDWCAPPLNVVGALQTCRPLITENSDTKVE